MRRFVVEGWLGGSRTAKIFHQTNIDYTFDPMAEDIAAYARVFDQSVDHGHIADRI